MKIESKKSYKTGIIVNYLFLVLFVALFYLFNHLGWKVWMVIAELLTLGVLVLTFYTSHIKTGLWRLVHASEDTLDEREMVVVLYALRNSYSVFTITSLIFIGIFVAMEIPVSAFGFVSLIYLAHTLPSVIIGWQE